MVKKIAKCILIALVFVACQKNYVPEPPTPEPPIDTPVKDPVRARFDNVIERAETAEKNIREMKNFLGVGTRLSADGRTLDEIIEDLQADSARVAPIFRGQFFDFRNGQESTVDSLMTQTSIRVLMPLNTIIDTAYVSDRMISAHHLTFDIREPRVRNFLNDTRYFLDINSNLVLLRLSPEQWTGLLYAIYANMTSFIDELNSLKDIVGDSTDMRIFCSDVQILEIKIAGLEYTISHLRSRIEIIIGAA